MATNAPKKELRAHLTLGETLLMYLMPVSNAVSWTTVFLTVAGTPRFAHVRLSDVLLAIALFYFFWALRNRYLAGLTVENGHFAFGTLAAGCALGLTTTVGRLVAASGAIAVFLAFAIAAKRVLVWPPSKLAYVMKKTLSWAHITRGYYVSSLFFWPMVIASIFLRPS